MTTALYALALLALAGCAAAGLDLCAELRSARWQLRRERIERERANRADEEYRRALALARLMLQGEAEALATVVLLDSVRP